jgi:hypothetical protein
MEELEARITDDAAELREHKAYTRSAFFHQLMIALEEHG